MPVITSARASTSDRRRLQPVSRTLVPAGLLLLFTLQCAWFVRTQSLTYDEPVHIAEGLDAWRNGRFQQYNDHPPLARLLFAASMISPEWQINLEPLPAGFRVHHISPDPQTLAIRARVVNVFLGLLLGVFLWAELSSIVSVTAANFALALFAFSPSLIANFSLATTDGVATLLIFVTAFRVLRWKQTPRWESVVPCGIVLGLLLLAKFSTLPMFLLAVLWMLVLVRGRICFHPFYWNWFKTPFVVIIAILTVWAGYFFHISRLQIKDGILTAIHPHWNTALIKPTRSKLNIDIPVPAGEFIAGLRDVALHNAHGQPAFFLGELSPTGGWKAYYPVTILLKWPLIVTVLAIIGLSRFVKGRSQLPRGVWIVISFPVLYFALAIFAHFNIGERHILPLYPFALFFAGITLEKVSQIRRGTIIALALLALNATDVLRYAPDYLSYFEFFVPPRQAYRLLADSNVDWGQGLLALQQYQKGHQQEQISLAYFGSVDPTIYGIHARALAENDHVTGMVIVSATNLSGEYLKDPKAYRWLLQYPIVEVLDHSLYVFRVPHP